MTAVTVLIRQLVESEFAVADRLLQAAFDRAASFLGLLRLTKSIEPDGLWCAVDSGRIAGTVSMVNYGPIGYIGLMAVDPPAQRRGIARQLVVHVLELLARRGCPLALLDATDQGAPLYESLGFVDDHTAYVFERETRAEAPVAQHEIRLAGDEDLAGIVAMDAPIFGCDRAKLLRALWSEHRGRCLVARDRSGNLSGYLFARDPVLGPWAALNDRVASDLLAAALALDFEYPPMVLVPRSNSSSIDLVTQSGFVQRRTLRHMRRGGDAPPGRPRCLYGQSSFGHG